MIKDIIEVLGNSNIALTMDELKQRINYDYVTDFAIEGAIAESKEIKQKKVGQVMEEFNLRKHSFNAHPTTRIFYLNEEQVENFAKKSRYYSQNL